MIGFRSGVDLERGIRVAKARVEEPKGRVAKQVTVIQRPRRIDAEMEEK
jgi:hypothetical protein